MTNALYYGDNLSVLRESIATEKALGLFLTLNEPTREMEKEAASAGLYETGGMKVPKLQILTAAQIQLAKNGCFRASERQGTRDGWIV